MMIPPLPFDVWCLIAKHIPRDTLATLYGVNAAFFDIAMSEEYRDVYIHHSENGCARPCLPTMSPVVLKRVRALVIRPSLYYKLKKSKHCKLIIEPTSEARRVPSQQLAACQKSLQYHIEKMIGLTALTIGCSPERNLKIFNSAVPLYSTALVAHAPHLTSLTLNIPVEGYPTLISTTPPFNVLTHLNVAIHSAYHNTMYEETLVAIAGFIARHASTLTNLALDTPSTLIHPLQLFTNIPKLPHLKELSLAIWFQRLKLQYPTNVDQFLQRQAESLTGLILRFSGVYHPQDSIYYDPPPAPAVFFLHPLFQVQLSNLRSLDLKLDFWSGHFCTPMNDHVVEYLRRLQSPLAKLTISGYVFSFMQVKDIVTVFGGEDSQLQSLDIPTQCLSCGLLDLLHKQLPRLTNLKLSFNSLDLSCKGAGTQERDQGSASDLDALTASFLQEMANRKYTDWGLRHFTVRLLFHPWGIRPMDLHRCGPMLAAALPNVITFNDVSREEFSRRPDPQKAQERKHYHDWARNRSHT